MLGRLVAVNTENPPGRESEAGELVRGVLADLGCRSEAIEFSPGRVNVVAVLENGPGPIFAFNTHIDTVPAGDGWTSDPFALRERGTSLYGRGACDAKGPLVSMLEAIRRLIEDRGRWSGTLLGVFVADEEASSRGAKEYVKTAPPIDYCVIGEPTSCRTVTAHKGSLRPRVRVHGQTAHSGMPDAGVNAILKTAPLLERIAAEHERIRQNRHPLVGASTLTVTRVHGGHADNVVPDATELLLDRRMIPGEDEEAVKAGLERLVADASAAAGTPMEIVEFKPTTGGPGETRSDHEVVLVAQRACERHNGHVTPLGGFQGGCDLVHFRAAGANGVVLGPGSLDVAHKPDEFVPEEELVRAAAIYYDIARALLSGGEPILPR
jgi:acetylornithine deacetylase